MKYVKNWWESRTMWVNLIAFAAFMTQYYTGNVVLPPELQGAILTVLNAILRFDTDSPIQ